MHNDHLSSKQSQSDFRLSSGTLSSESLARRRALIKGLSKGSAVVALAVPIQTLAANTIVGGQLCTISGAQSNAGSQKTGPVTTCSGFSSSYYADLTKWPGYTPGNNPPATASAIFNGYTEKSTFASVFGDGSSNGQQAWLFNIIKSGSPPSERVWITALLNAIKNQQQPGFLYFPYTPTEVLALYKNPTLRDKAFAFFQGYMQTRLS